MNKNLLVVALLTSLAAFGCGSSGSSDESTVDALEGEADQTTAATVTINGVMRGKSQREFFIKSIRPSTYLKAAIIRDLGFSMSGVIPRGIKLKLAEGEWASAPVDIDLEFDRSKHEENRSFTVTGKSPNIELGLTFTVQEEGDDLQLTIVSTAKVKGNQAASQKLAEAATALLQAFEAERIDRAILPDP
jgi:hypothetical protein